MPSKLPNTSPIRILSSKDGAELERLFTRREQRLDKAEREIVPTLHGVRREGDRALLRYARKWDGFQGRSAADLKVPKSAWAMAWEKTPVELQRAIQTAAENIRSFCRLQMPREWRRQIAPGVRAGQLVRPLDSVGCYVPGHRYPLPSTLMMTAIPARVAGVRRIVACTPHAGNEILAVAHAVGIDELYTLGGAQAIAALAYGTETIPAVAKIVGPGSAYVAAAKRAISHDAAIEFVAGPTEVLIVAEEGNAAWLAADMLAQAEHDVDAAALLLTTSRKLAGAVSRELGSQLATLPTGGPAAASLAANGAIVVVRRLAETVALINRFAPEHLCVPAGFPLEQIQHAGSIFIGPYSPEAAGDYASGPNHVLPTGGMAGVRGGLSVNDFVKIISVQELERSGLRRLAPTIVTLARAEGLEAHARSVEIRVAPAGRDGL